MSPGRWRGAEIEAESFRILESRADLSRFGPLGRAVVARVVHASADVEYALTMEAGEEAVAAGLAALAAGAPVIADVMMVARGITGVAAECYLGDEESGAGEITRSAAGMRVAARRHPGGAVVVVGCAPTALEEVLALHRAGAFAPALVVGLPVGFVGAAAAKEALRASGLPSISNRGEKGGSAVAAAAVNALCRTVGGTVGRQPAGGTVGRQPAGGTVGRQPAGGTVGRQPAGGTVGRQPAGGTVGRATR